MGKTEKSFIKPKLLDRALDFAPPTGFMVAIAPLSCPVLDITPPLSYAEHFHLPHYIVEYIMSPAGCAMGIAHKEPFQTKGPYNLRDI
ncbi:hypothetical protein Q7C36_018404 [Tachysurus vachellii]|uniref:Uncharacterized protein n=1 Tax=Tachysurus vachellii TaxID=175792 RepID=A0AA88M2K7_TACVA|nr:hypothetical protein Q7C36_018404 [Tachysurus vachellii]